MINIQDVLMISDIFSGYGYPFAPTADFNSDWAINMLDIETMIQDIMEIE